MNIQIVQIDMVKSQNPVVSNLKENHLINSLANIESAKQKSILIINSNTRIRCH